MYVVALSDIIILVVMTSEQQNDKIATSRTAVKGHQLTVEEFGDAYRHRANRNAKWVKQTLMHSSKPAHVQF